MKRRISLIIAFALSFLFMFSSVAVAEEITAQTPVITSEATQTEVAKTTPTDTNQANSPAPPKASDLVDKGELNPIKLKPCNVTCPGGAVGYMTGSVCVPC